MSKTNTSWSFENKKKDERDNVMYSEDERYWRIHKINANASLETLDTLQ